ncbi:Inosine-5'-monophosphate dehydrogenase [Serinicoccus hydrothermalis]|uniref:Inosine-5'-monophosphate dehydrogenase n=1 Tax=Serinicoccus hydrothermalis TaxID=1758689 RepID=A0A1B1N7U8_9MICO|nr:CBS domain-containing protein [Serinicoccus hydrothermalis]ANS77506.1 Inosine-5'-monophosphate dehydrogenase [Serinicoccus hydrothermalis]
MRVADLIKKKGSTVTTLPATATVAELLETLDDAKIGAVVVLDGEDVAGIVSERDVVHHLRGGRDQSAALSDLMTTDVKTCTLEDDLTHLATTMTQGRFRHLPVVQDGRLEGIISIGDVVKARLDALEAERDHLESYLRQ